MIKISGIKPQLNLGLHKYRIYLFKVMPISFAALADFNMINIDKLIIFGSLFQASRPFLWVRHSLRCSL